MTYKIQFYSDWHIGSGQAVAGDVDAAVLRDEDKLPFIPGRTLKGLIRQAAQELADYNYPGIDAAFIEAVFGKSGEAQGAEDEQAEDTKLGQAIFSSAYLSKEVAAKLKDQTRLIYRKISSTKITHETGVADDNTLRRIEVCAPLCLYAEIEGLSAAQEKLLKICLKNLKYLGLQRHRGMGAVVCEAI